MLQVNWTEAPLNWTKVSKSILQTSRNRDPRESFVIESKFKFSLLQPSRVNVSYTATDNSVHT